MDDTGADEDAETVEEEALEVTEEEYLMEIDTNNVVIEVVQQRGGNSCPQLFARLLQDQQLPAVPHAS